MRYQTLESLVRSKQVTVELVLQLTGITGYPVTWAVTLHSPTASMNLRLSQERATASLLSSNISFLTENHLLTSSRRAVSTFSCFSCLYFWTFHPHGFVSGRVRGQMNCVSDLAQKGSALIRMEQEVVNLIYLDAF